LKNLIEKFNSISLLKKSLEREIEDTEFIINDYSNLLGEKIRSNEELALDDPEFLELKAKLDGSSPNESSDSKSSDSKSSDSKSSDSKSSDSKSSDSKSSDSKKESKKRKRTKKGVSDKWYDLNEILVYNGMGLKGELELYFKTIDELKSKLDNLRRTILTLNNLIEKGLKKDMGCIAFRGTEGILHITFLKSSGVREFFSLKSKYSGSAITTENLIKIGI
jgi:hypothetical protein